jgi:hypothetical protein
MRGQRHTDGARWSSGLRFRVKVAVIARKRGSAQTDFEPRAWAHLSAENASRPQAHTKRLQAGSITCENSNPERLDHGDSRFFLVSFSNVQTRGRFRVVPAARFRAADINQFLESKQHD